jgi:hypothetical protein
LSHFGAPFGTVLTFFRGLAFARGCVGRGLSRRDGSGALHAATKFAKSFSHLRGHELTHLERCLAAGGECNPLGPANALLVWHLAQVAGAAPLTSARIASSPNDRSWYRVEAVNKHRSCLYHHDIRTAEFLLDLDNSAHVTVYAVISND